MADKQVAGSRKRPISARFLSRLCCFGHANRAARGFALVVCALCGCSAVQTQDRYTGDSPQCEGGFGTSSTLVRKGSSFAYTPADGALVLRGTLGRDGTLSGSLALHPGNAGIGTGGAPSTTPVRKTPDAETSLVLSVSGRLAGDSATLRYIAASCHATVKLVRADTGLL